MLLIESNLAPCRRLTSLGHLIGMLCDEIPVLKRLSQSDAPACLTFDLFNNASMVPIIVKKIVWFQKLPKQCIPEKRADSGVHRITPYPD
ncbi:hypothetical protein BL250_03805 [Erwinia sp. OLTSP20]|uniref:hypothetical protein n=1 Tax=unclassified Erwinia TaxID=2622719 RepID=UPI000C187E11|nr:MULTISPECIES: hypothetical protein [unclassified Erwinia]PIJ51627.1 hypothetical protein BV501_02735 [Erwinia sp. OAMSP11]PIJ69704.1 hypothetical protein BK416_13990 [Erwinia sp. OLSSP12]PIJ79427.1 hypothetical protein BLD47_14070 [Erwinia sp. OLCASP19]PIJ86597.1 hypothetical protein BLD46_02560 [Erwinia sp. OLMTSP26]PIJ88038.1 hypothetical protein BLD49_03240 [Erwinia sp. OLMDSP33]